MFCVECGKEDPIFKNGVCASCYVKSTIFTQGPQVISLTVCPKCGGHKFRNLWHDDSLDDTILREIKNQYTVLPELNQVSYSLTCDPVDIQFECVVTISGMVVGHSVVESHHVQIRTTKVVCDVCSKQFGGYYEGILQIRATDRKLSEEELSLIDDQITHFVSSERMKGNRALFISDVAEEHGGLDYYLSERGMAYGFAKKLKSRFGGELKQSSSLVGMKEGREVTRVTVVLRLPSYQVGDFIGFQKHFYQVKQISGSKVLLVKLATWKEETFLEKDLEKIIVYPYDTYFQSMIVVSQSPTELQVMHPESYATYDLKKPKPLDIQSETISVVRLHEILFLVPEKKEREKGD